MTNQTGDYFDDQIKTYEALAAPFRLASEPWKKGIAAIFSKAVSDLYEKKFEVAKTKIPEDWLKNLSIVLPILTMPASIRPAHMVKGMIEKQNALKGFSENPNFPAQYKDKTGHWEIFDPADVKTRMELIQLAILHLQAELEKTGLEYLIKTAEAKSFALIADEAPMRQSEFYNPAEQADIYAGLEKVTAYQPAKNYAPMR